MGHFYISFELCGSIWQFNNSALGGSQKLEAKSRRRFLRANQGFALNLMGSGFTQRREVKTLVHFSLTALAASSRLG
jgi:hypothetical protein